MGDKKNAIKKLQQSIKGIKYPSHFELKEIDIGSPREYLKLYHYLFMDYSPLIANEILTKHHLELNSKNDKIFVDGVYRIMRDMFAYVPKLTREHFFSTGYAQVKALMTCEIIALIQSKVKCSQPPQTQATCSVACSSLTRTNNTLSVNLKSNEFDANPQLKTGVLSHTSNSMSKSTSKSSLKIPTPINHKKLTPTKKPIESSYSPIRAQIEPILKEAIETLNMKVENFQERLSSLEPKKMNQSIQTVSDSSFESVQNDKDELCYKITKNDFENLLSRLAMVEDQNENFKARITVLETQNLTLGRDRNIPIPSRYSDPFVDANDDTIFHSFVNTSRLGDDDGSDDDITTIDKDENIEIDSPIDLPYVKIGNKGLIFQGELVELGKRGGFSNDFSPNDILRNDATPTMTIPSKTSKFIDSNGLNMRAKDLVERASNFSKDLNSNMKSM